jgi:hypothetical protein
MYPIYLTAIITAIIVSTSILVTVFNPYKLIPTLLTVYFAIYIHICK